MSTLEEINAVAGEVISEFGESATYCLKGGETLSITAVRFDPYQRQDLVGDSISTTDPSIWVLLSEVPSPERGDLILVGESKYTVRDVEIHSLRGYARLHLSE